MIVTNLTGISIELWSCYSNYKYTKDYLFNNKFLLIRLKLLHCSRVLFANVVFSIKKLLESLNHKTPLIKININEIKKLINTATL